MHTTPQHSRALASEPVVHDLPLIPLGNQVVDLRLVIRRAEDATWRGKLVFDCGEGDEAVSTAEIFCAATEPDLWESVRDLRDHHIRDLYRSLLPE